jgi:hypothetical protein
MIVLEEKKTKISVEKANRRSGLKTSEKQGKLVVREI